MEIVRSVNGPKLQGPRAEDVLVESNLVQKILVSCLQTITKLLVKGVNLETIIDMQSWCKTWLPNGSKHIRAKQKLHRKPKSSWKPKVIYTDKSLKFGKAYEDLSWNHCTSTPHRSQTNGIAERAVRRVKRLRHCCNQVWMKNGEQIPWNAKPICERSLV